MEVKKKKYKNIEIVYEVSEEGKFECSALGIFRSHPKGQYLPPFGYDTIGEAEKAIQDELDEFLSTTPKTFKELAEAIEKSLVWTGYEECHVDEFIIKTLVTNFKTIKNGS